MNFIKNNSGVIAVIALVIAVIGVYTPVGRSVLGGVTNYDEVDASAVKIGGTNGSRLSLVAVGTCSLVSTASINATSTGTGTCAATGALAGDTVVVDLATTSTIMTRSWTVLSAVSTTDSITVLLFNGTGGNLVPNAIPTLGSSTQYQIYRSTSTVPGL